MVLLHTRRSESIRDSKHLVSALKLKKCKAFIDQGKRVEGRDAGHE